MSASSGPLRFTTPGNKKAPPPLRFSCVATSMMPEQGQQQDDRQRHAKQPKQSTSSKTHDFLLLLPRPDDAEDKKKFLASKRGRRRSEHGVWRLSPPIPAGDDLDLAAAFVGEGQELFNRQSIRDPFGEPLGTCGLIFEILDRVQAPPPRKAPNWSPELFGRPWCVRAANRPLSASPQVDGPRLIARHRAGHWRRPCRPCRAPRPRRERRRRRVREHRARDR